MDLEEAARLGRAVMDLVSPTTAANVGQETRTSLSERSSRSSQTPPPPDRPGVTCSGGDVQRLVSRLRCPSAHRPRVTIRRRDDSRTTTPSAVRLVFSVLYSSGTYPYAIWIRFSSAGLLFP